jgi:hypothetical protein
MLYKGILAVHSETDKKHVNTLCGQNADILSVKASDTDSDH